jgi:SAM-dependent methyltransferase
MERCPDCERLVVARGGGLDLLGDDSREAADRFTKAYRALRTREGWADTSGTEDPASGNAALWRSRLRSVSGAVATLRREWSPANRPVVADIGSGGGWAARLFNDADVLAFDLLDVPARAGSVTVRADMRKLPLRNGSVDVALYAASLHYSLVEDAVREAARVLRPRGVVVAVDSPIYPDRASQAKAAARSAAYYARVGFPELADHYHPIDARFLRSTLEASGFDVLRLDRAGRLANVWRRLARRPSSVVVARLAD